MLFILRPVSLSLTFVDYPELCKYCGILNKECPNCVCPPENFANVEARFLPRRVPEVVNLVLREYFALSLSLSPLLPSPPSVLHNNPFLLPLLSPTLLVQIQSARSMCLDSDLADPQGRKKRMEEAEETLRSQGVDPELVHINNPLFSLWYVNLHIRRVANM